MALNEPKWWHIAVYGALALTGGAGALYCFKEAIRRDDIIKRLKKDHVMSLKDVQQLTEKWEEIVQKARGSVTAGGRSKKVAPLKDMAMVGRLYSQFVMIDEKLGAKYLFERREEARISVSRRVSSNPKSWEERHHNRAIHLLDMETEASNTSVKGALLDIKDTRALRGAAKKVLVRKELGEMTVWRQLAHRLFYAVDAIYGVVLDLLGFGMIFEIGTQHSKIQVGLLSSAIVIATVDLDSETNSLVFRDVLACATNIEDLIKILNKQAYNLIAWGQLWTIVGMVFGLVTLVAYQKKHQFSKVHQIRSAALDKFLTYPEETQEKLQCIPCRAAAKEIICLPCKHAVACEDCWSVTPNKRECMVCKQAVTGTARILDS